MISGKPGEQQQILQELLDSLTRIDSTPSPPPKGDKLLPEINQVNKRETITLVYKVSVTKKVRMVLR